MPAIPATINGVFIEFSDNANNSVDQRIVDALKKILSKDIAPGHTLNKVYISSANDQHSLPSRHVQGKGKAVDISRINSLRMSANYLTNDTVKAITDALQTKFEDYPHRRENYGPLFQKKLGKDHSVAGHKDHIHFSVN